MSLRSVVILNSSVSNAIKKINISYGHGVAGKSAVKWCCTSVIALVVSIGFVSSSVIAKDKEKHSSQMVGSTAKGKSKTKKFHDWYYRCLDQKKTQKTKKITAKQCEVLQVAQVKTPSIAKKKSKSDKNVSVLTLAFSKGLPKKGSKKRSVLLTVLTPLNIHLPSGFTLTVDKKKPFNIAYRNCNQAGCWVNAELQAKHLKYMKKGKSGFGQMRLLNGQNVRIKFSLKGLEAALAALDKEIAIN